MLCIVEKSLSIFMTLRIYLRELCLSFCDIFLFEFKPLSKGVLLIYVFIMETARCCFLGSKSICFLSANHPCL